MFYGKIEDSRYTPFTIEVWCWSLGFSGPEKVCEDSGSLAISVVHDDRLTDDTCEYARTTQRRVQRVARGVACVVLFRSHMHLHFLFHSPSLAEIVL